MSTKDLAAVYGRGNSRALINRAIRAELVGGDHCLDALNALDQIVFKFRERGWVEGLADAEAALSHARRLHASMSREIRRRYQMPLED